MQANYSLSYPLIATNTPATVDLILNFNAQTQADSPRRPLNLSLVIDRSGSMAGQSLRYAIKAAQQLVESLTADDIVSVVIYDDQPETILPPQTVEDKAAICKQIGRIRAGGCTNLSGGWLMGCDCVKSRQTSDRLNRVLLLTDGQANMGITDPKVLTKTAQNQAETGIITTTLGFGSYFNEDLLISIADAAGGNFYFIQSPDDVAQVFRIELESLTAVVAQNLTVKLQPETGVKITEVLNNYRSIRQGEQLELFLGDVYQVEAKQLALQLSIPAQANPGEIKLVTVTYDYKTLVEDSIQSQSEQFPISVTIGSEEQASQSQLNSTVFEQTSQLRIARLKDEAIALADQGQYKQAAEKLRSAVEDIRSKLLDEIFELAEEIEQLNYYAQRIENHSLDAATRKEMRDQSYQTRNRSRSDLKLRGITSGNASSLPGVEEAGDGILLKCFREGGKLRLRVISEGYNPDFNVQFPRNIRQEGVTYVVDEIILSPQGDFYRVKGDIRRLGTATQTELNPTQTRSKSLQAAKATGSYEDLETVDEVGNGILVQCVKEGSKLRARVVSDGYNPDFNIRFPRNIRAEGVLYVVDEVRESSDGKSYAAYGKIRRLLQ
ncbi:vWA domain-containing protein [Limnoraphis robusta]|uniref:VWA domain-containing protein n=1 Tax=Limnoraphis robusta CCNP1315 TaxID=3110306 RepID=A0ABU5U029_9CYAN|nr:VWA domain-containing protein [Limnoraphis robusta]MEA5520539.1 VWA domain-containing protein [Limnoraphis robusta CCNP1315]MEA5547587.1 VWA domain-containing protein [Limnoraphis robusta CCNP1324]